MSERAGIEIDYCPDCRGVWLDRGELDKIIDRAGPASPEPAAQHQPHQDRSDRSYESSRPGQQPYRKKKKENWLAELFE